VENAALQIASSLICTIVWPACWLMYALACYADRTKMATRPVRAEVAMILHNTTTRAARSRHTISATTADGQRAVRLQHAWAISRW